MLPWWTSSYYDGQLVEKFYRNWSAKDYF